MARMRVAKAPLWFSCDWDEAEQKYHWTPEKSSGYRRCAALEKVPDFPRVPLEKIGLFTDEYRRALPNVPRGLTAPVGAAFDSETDVKNTDQRVRN